MTPEQEKHLEDIKQEICRRIDAKYRRGQKEHGGNLWERAVFPDMADEVTDFNTYFVTLQTQLRQMHALVCSIKESLANGEWAKAQDMLDTLDAAFVEQLGRT